MQALVLFLGFGDLALSNIVCKDPQDLCKFRGYIFKKYGVIAHNDEDCSPCNFFVLPTLLILSFLLEILRIGIAIHRETKKNRAIGIAPNILPTSNFNVQAAVVTEAESVNQPLDNEFPLSVEEDNSAPVSLEENNAAHVRVDKDNSAPVSLEEDNAAHVRVDEDNSAPVSLKEKNTAHVRVDEDNCAPVSLEENSTPCAHVRVEENNTAPVRMEEDITAIVRVEENNTAPVRMEEGNTASVCLQEENIASNAAPLGVEEDDYALVNAEEDLGELFYIRYLFRQQLDISQNCLPGSMPEHLQENIEPSTIINPSCYISIEESNNPSYPDLANQLEMTLPSTNLSGMSGLTHRSTSRSKLMSNNILKLILRPASFTIIMIIAFVICVTNYHLQEHNTEKMADFIFIESLSIVKRGVGLFLPVFLVVSEQKIIEYVIQTVKKHFE